MSPAELLAHPLSQAATWTLLHFVWQGLAIAVALAATVELLGLRRPADRYACSLAAWLLMAACPLATFAWLSPGEPQVAAAVGATSDFAGEAIAEHSSAAPEAWHSHQILDAGQPYVLAVWLTGVVLLGGRLLLGLVGLRQLRHNRLPLPPDLAQRVELLGRRLYIRAGSLVFLSHRVGEALAVGLVRPIVLIPAAWATEMPLPMLEAVIAHELAHLRRHDLWVNLLQRVVETLLFYHPAVWWLSRRLRAERELCCDELAVAATGQKLEYVEALVHVAHRRVARVQPVLAAGIRGEKNMRLLQRVRNVLGLSATADRSRLWPAGFLALALPLGAWAWSAGLITGAGVAVVADDDREDDDDDDDDDREEGRKEGARDDDDDDENEGREEREDDDGDDDDKAGREKEDDDDDKPAAKKGEKEADDDDEKEGGKEGSREREDDDGDKPAAKKGEKEADDDDKPAAKKGDKEADDDKAAAKKGDKQREDGNDEKKEVRKDLYRERKDGDDAKKEVRKDREVEKTVIRKDGEGDRKEVRKDGDKPAKEGAKESEERKIIRKDGERREFRIEIKDGEGDGKVAELTAMVKKLMAENERLQAELFELRGGKKREAGLKDKEEVFREKEGAREKDGAAREKEAFVKRAAAEKEEVIRRAIKAKDLDLDKEAAERKEIEARERKIKEGGLKDGARKEGDDKEVLIRRERELILKKKAEAAERGEKEKEVPKEKDDQ